MAVISSEFVFLKILDAFCFAPKRLFEHIIRLVFAKPSESLK